MAVKREMERERDREEEEDEEEVKGFFLWFLLFSSSPLPLVSVLNSIFKTLDFITDQQPLFSNCYCEILGSILKILTISMKKSEMDILV